MLDYQNVSVHVLRVAKIFFQQHYGFDLVCIVKNSSYIVGMGWLPIFPKYDCIMDCASHLATAMLIVYQQAVGMYAHIYIPFVEH